MIKVLEAFDQNRGRVRVPSSLIGVLQRQCQGIDSACPDPEPQQFTSLAETLGRIPDPRRVRGRRYRLGSLLALCLVAVLGGATSLAAIARIAADTDYDLREQLGLTSNTPNASTLGRLLARPNGDALDDAVGAWLARYATDPVDEPSDTLVGLAVDGKTVRGSRTRRRSRPPARRRAARLPDRDRPASDCREEQRNPCLRP